MRTLVITDELWHRLRGHLLADDEERAAFLLAKSAGPRLVAHDVVLIPDGQLERRTTTVSVALPALIDVMNRAVLENSILVEAHSHPLSPGRVGFSRIDDQGHAEMVAYLSEVMPGRPYGAIVVGHDAVQCRAWRDGEASPIDRILVSGDALHWWPGDGSPAAGDGGPGQWHSKRYDRQVRAFGPAGQDLITSTRVAIVGLGGIGSIVASELAHLGVRDIVLIDDDKVEELEPESTGRGHPR